MDHYTHLCLKIRIHSTLQVSFHQQTKAFTTNSKSQLTVYDKKNLVDNVKVGLAVPKYERNIDSISDLNSSKSFGKSVDWTIQGTDDRNGVMKQTKSELDDGQLDQYRLHKSSDQDQFKAIQKLINNKSLSSSRLWNQAGSPKSSISKC